MAKELKVGMKITVKSQEELLKKFDEEGWRECPNGNWRKDGYPTFWAKMFQQCCSCEFEVKRMDGPDGCLCTEEWILHTEWLEGF